MLAGQVRRIAVIDIGTNTLVLLVVEVREGAEGIELVPIHHGCEFGRLGKGLDATGALSTESVARSLDIVRKYRAASDGLGAEVHAIGTQALREASNASAFVIPAEAILGTFIEVIAGVREAELVYRAVAEFLPIVRGEPFVIADVGGGSTEVIVSSANGDDVASFTSLPIGSVRLHERYLHSDPPAPEQVAALMADIDQALSDLDLPIGVPLVGSAGTATTLSSIAQRLPAYDADRVHGHIMPRQAVERQLAILLERTIDERRRLPGLPPQRADVIAAGSAIFARLLHRLEAEIFVVNDRGIRWGRALELALG